MAEVVQPPSRQFESIFTDDGRFKGYKGFGGANRRRFDAITQIMQAMNDTAGLGDTERRNITEWETGKQGAVNQGAINRGLFNTTVLDAGRRGISSDAQKMRLGVDESVQDRLNSLRSAIAAIWSGSFGGQKPAHKPNFGEILGSSFANSFGESSGKAASQMGSSFLGGMF